MCTYMCVPLFTPNQHKREHACMCVYMCKYVLCVHSSMSMHAHIHACVHLAVHVCQQFTICSLEEVLGSLPRIPLSVWTQSSAYTGQGRLAYMYTTQQSSIYEQSMAILCFLGGFLSLSTTKAASLYTQQAVPTLIVYQN